MRIFSPAIMAPLALLAALPMTALPPTALAEPASHLTAHGSFNVSDLCANVEQACSASGNMLTLHYTTATPAVAGDGLATLQFRPYPQCPPWFLSIYLEFDGAFDDDRTAMTGTVSGVTLLAFSIYDKRTGGCSRRQKQDPIEGVFDAKAADDILSGQMTIPAAQGSNQAAFRLTVEASDGPPPARDGAPTPACNNLLDLMGPKGDTGMSAACGGRG